MTCGFMPRKHEERINFLSLRQTQLTLQTKFSLEYQISIQELSLFLCIILCAKRFAFPNECDLFSMIANKYIRYII